MKYRGFTLIEVMIVVAIIAILSLVVIPSYLTHHRLSQQKACLANINMLNRATEAYIMNGKASSTAMISIEDLTPPSIDEIKDTYFIRYKPECPAGGEYTYDPKTMSWNCSLGGNDEANNGYPHGSGVEP